MSTDICDNPNILFVAETDNERILKSLFEGIKEFADEINIYLTELSMRIIANSDVSLSMIDCTLNSSGFSKYKIDLNRMSGLKEIDYEYKDSTTGKMIKKTLLMKQIFIKTGALQRLLKNVKSKNIVRFLITKDDELSFKVEVINADAKQCTTHSIKHMKCDNDAIECLDNATFKYEINIGTACLKDNITNIKSIYGAKLVTILYNGKMLIFSADGDNVSTTSINEEIKRHTNEKPTLVTPCSHTFDLSVLSNVIKFSNISESVDMYLDQNIPLLLEYQIGKFGTLRVVISPADQAIGMLG